MTELLARFTHTHSIVWAHIFCCTTTKTNVDNLRVVELSGTWKWTAASTWSPVLFSAVYSSVFVVILSFCHWIWELIGPLCSHCECLSIVSRGFSSYSITFIWIGHKVAQREKKTENIKFAIDHNLLFISVAGRFICSVWKIWCFFSFSHCKQLIVGLKKTEFIRQTGYEPSLHQCW